jgi:hypothetical protein
MSIKPGQKFIQFPNRKISIGSKLPTFSLNYTKGINGLFGSDVDFDKWSFTVFGDRNFKLAGTLRYKLGVGGFLNRDTVFIPDFQHFNGNRSVSASEYMNSFSTGFLLREQHHRIFICYRASRAPFQWITDQ